ncbi:hypothetical protein HUB94_20740 (plasmid) [Paenibacillus cellulosilyticus]|uniref:hypothetical protein n=1 Tax=Paenibacillus cellulosilyticus TaxID=375489 RepID=UPI000D717DEA|nr:hypothetical protein [Paenibacillus cellulosilyticus]QKS46905.1 hypothetical protein HUB94_20740 [Paenibacillus cellulosilyticus]
MKKYIIKKYGVFCPICSHELNWYAGMSSKTNMFKCLYCKKYYLKEEDNDLTEAEDRAIGINNILQYNDEHNEYQGTPSSTFFAPNWLRKYLKN